MALKEPLMVKTVESAASLSLQAQVGESYRVNKIVIDPGTANYAILSIDKTTVGYFRLGGTQESDLALPSDAVTNKNVLNTLIDLGLWRDYPIATGETLLIKADTGSFASVVVNYSVYDEADVKNTEPNGSAAVEYDVMLYGQPASITTGKYNQYTVAEDPDEFPKFPFEEVVPAKTTIEIKGLRFKAVGKTANSAADMAVTKYIKFQRNRVVLFDDDKNGLPYIGAAPAADGTVVSAGQLIDVAKSQGNDGLYIFDKPLTFVDGEDLDLYVDVETTSGSGTTTTADVELGLVSSIKTA